MRAPRPPFSLETPSFAFPSLVAFAARAPLGGPRETAIAVFVAARLADDVVPARALPAATRRARAASCRRWLATLTIAEPARRALVDLATATEADAAATLEAWRRVIEVTALPLDAGARVDVARLTLDLASQAVVRT